METNQQEEYHSFSTNPLSESSERATVEYEETRELKPKTTEKSETSSSSSATPGFPIRVVNQNGNELFFKVRPTTSVQKLIDAYCKRMSTSASAVRFMVDGERMVGDKTISDYDLKEEDIVDVLLQQTGGAGEDEEEEEEEEIFVMEL